MKTPIRQITWKAMGEYRDSSMIFMNWKYGGYRAAQDLV